MTVNGIKQLETIAPQHAAQSGHAPDAEGLEATDKVSTGKLVHLEQMTVAARATVGATRALDLQRLADAVKSGQYFPSPDQIAQHIIDAMRTDEVLRQMMAQ